MGRILLSIALTATLSGVAFGQTTPALEMTPGGRLRVGMIGITVLGGVAEPVAKFMGQKLGAAFEPVMYPDPEAYLRSFGKGEWDIAIGPRRKRPIPLRTFGSSALSTSRRPERNFPMWPRSTRPVPRLAQSAALLPTAS
jgi:hypothetical protein